MGDMRSIRGALVAALFCSGCATTADVERRFAAVRADDGLSGAEAIVVAQHTLLGSRFAGEYDVLHPYTIPARREPCLTEYWVITFRGKKPLGSLVGYYVVLEKGSARLVRAEPIVYKGNALAVMLRDLKECEMSEQ